MIMDRPLVRPKKLMPSPKRSGGSTSQVLVLMAVDEADQHRPCRPRRPMIRASGVMIRYRGGTSTTPAMASRKMPRRPLLSSIQPAMGRIQKLHTA